LLAGFAKQPFVHSLLVGLGLQRLVGLALGVFGIADALEPRHDALLFAFRASLECRFGRSFFGMYFFFYRCIVGICRITGFGRSHDLFGPLPIARIGSVFRILEEFVGLTLQLSFVGVMDVF